MKYLLLTIFLICMLAHSFTTNSVAVADEAVKHLDLPDVENLAEAKRVFLETTAQLKEKTVLDSNELHEIHIITYSLERAIAYFVENLGGDKKVVAQQMAEVVELVHIASENSRSEDTGAHLENYYRVADVFRESR